jgi:SAM-dependent methyltransferase
MNWSYWRAIPWIDTRAKFVSRTPVRGSLLDLGSSDGETLCHMSELRPDIHFFSVDIVGPPARTPPATTFARVDLESQPLPWPDRSFDSITCMHLIEHLRTTANLWREIARVLKPGGRVYFETPGTESLLTASAPGELRGRVTLNFYDDPTHVLPVPVETMAKSARESGLEPAKAGRSRNWIFAASYPFFALLPPRRNRYVAKLHWLGWSVYLIAQKPLTQ